ncbi:MAG: MMPL family transporter, partial [Jiangellaceae bacterium]
MLGQLATFVVRHARLVLAAFLVVVAAVAVLGFGAFAKLQTAGFDDPAAESTAAAELLEQRFGGESDLVFLVRADAGTVDEGPAAEAGAALSDRLAADPDLSHVTSYWTTGAQSMKSVDGTQALVVANIAHGDSASIADNYSGDAGAVEVIVGGSAVAGDDIDGQVGADLALAESIAVPVILVLLVVAFGSVVAALLPLVVGAIAIMGTFGELSVLGSATDVSIYAINLTTALGLGLGIDYALLMVSRYREELAAGRAVPDAVVRTVETAGRTILFSGLAVAASLAALLVFPLYFLRSFAYAGIGVVAIAVAGAIVALPALLAVLGTRVNAGSLPWLRRPRSAAAPFWGRLAARAMRRPLLAGGAVVALLVAAALPLLSVEFGTPDDRVLPTSAASRQVGDAIRDGFASDDTTAIDVVTTGPVDSAPLAEYASQISTLSAVDRVDSSAGTFVDGDLVDQSPVNAAFSAGGSERLAVVTSADAKSQTAKDLVGDVRGAADPEGVDALVGGASAALVDSLAAIGDRLPLAIAIVALATFVVLFLFTGSVVQPLRALFCNALTLGATLGIMVLVFQEGFGSSVLGFTPQPLDMSMLVLLFCIAFGLSMDYEVFVISRIKERHDAGAT